MRPTFSKQFLTALALVTAVAVVMPWWALASDVDVAVVDVTDPTGSVTLQPGQSSSITINMSVTGAQAGTATFEVYRDWTLSGGGFTGSNPQEFTVGQRAGGDPATTFSTLGTVSVATGQAAGTFTLAVGAFDITNSNPTGAKLQAGASSTYQVIVSSPPPPPSDTTAPTGASIVIDDGAAWTNNSSGAVTIDVSASDNVGVARYRLAETQTGLATASDVVVSPAEASFNRNNLPFTLTGSEGASKAIWLRVYDAAGNFADASDTIGWDKTAPTISRNSSADACSVPGDNGWCRGTQTAGFSASDATSGMASPCNTDPGVSCEFTQQTTTNGTAVSIASGPASDVAGNTNPGINAGPFKIDSVKPDLNISGAAGGSFNVCTLPTRPTFSPTDLTSLVNPDPSKTYDTWSTPSHPSGVGSYTYTAKATDYAGNVETETRTYTVTYGAAVGNFLQPINTDGSSRFKLGSTIPVKFQIYCGTTPVTNAVAKLNIKKKDNTANPGVDEATSTSNATTGNLFRYDSGSQQYIFNLSTKQGYVDNPSGSISAFEQGSWVLSIMLDDGTSKSVEIQLVR